MIPQFQHGERVIKSGIECNYHGTIQEVIEPNNIDTILGMLEERDPPTAKYLTDTLAKSDKDFREYPLYFVEPDSSLRGEVAPYEQAVLICPDLTVAQYRLITGRRMFMVTESQLFPEQ